MCNGFIFLQVSAPSYIWWHAGDECRVFAGQQELAAIHRSVAGEIRRAAVAAELYADSTGKGSCRDVRGKVRVSFVKVSGVSVTEEITITCL